MYVLGISEEPDSGAVLLKDNIIIAAVNEERLNRKKLYQGFPKLSINEVFSIANISGEKVNQVALSSFFSCCSRYG